MIATIFLIVGFILVAMAIYYDFIEAVGGAEQVTIELANHLKEDIIVSGVNKSSLELLPSIDGGLISLGTLSSIPLWKTYKSIVTFERVKSVGSSRVNLYSGSNALVAVKHSAANKNYYYCHTPPRFAYDLYDFYQNNLPAYQAFILKYFAKYVRRKYEPALASMDRIYSNSLNVQKRLKEYLGYDSEVVYPPIKTEGYKYSKQQGYYLSTARLENYKRVELIVEAFLKMPDKKLKISSGGSLLSKLRNLVRSAPNIEVLGWVSDESLKKLVSESIATIYIPIDEDFGMSPVESMAAGKPVLGVNEGGVAETVLHCETGWLCQARPCVEDVIEGIHYLGVERAEKMRKDCEERASYFEPEQFYSKMKSLFN